MSKSCKICEASFVTEARHNSRTTCSDKCQRDLELMRKRAYRALDPAKWRANRREAKERAAALGKAWAVRKTKPRPPKPIHTPWPRQATCGVCAGPFMARRPRHQFCSDPCRTEDKRLRDQRRAPRDRKPYFLKPENHQRKLERGKQYREENAEVLQAKDRQYKKWLRENRPDYVRENRYRSKIRRAVAEATVALNSGI